MVQAEGGLSFFFLSFKNFFSVRALQNPCPDEQTRQQMCVGNSVFWGYLGLFKLDFSCTKGFCEICWVFGRRFLASDLERLRN